MSKYHVVVVNLGYPSFKTEQDILADLDAAVVPAEYDCKTEEDVIAVARDAHAILIREAPVSRRVIDALVHCRAIVRYGVGVDNIDLQAAADKGIYVANVPGYGTEEVSDHAVALLLACIRNLLRRDQSLRQGRFETDIDDQIFRTTGKVLGLIGYGQISQAFHRKWKGFQPARVLICDPYADQKLMAANGGQSVDLDLLLAESDYVSLHAPLTADTRHLIDTDALERMKPTAILVNTARGELIHESALVKALSENQILAAGLDVFESEPLPPDHPLIGLSNVILTSHVGWYSKNSVRELQTRAAGEVKRILSGERPEYWVNPW
jgi:D-3-phosphoglycerate dehydrogenase